jgi:hypothetical protein
MAYVASRIQTTIARVLQKYAGVSRSQMKRRLYMANPFRCDRYKSRTALYERECRKAITRLYPNGESGKTLFSEIEETP